MFPERACAQVSPLPFVGVGVGGAGVVPSETAGGGRPQEPGLPSGAAETATPDPLTTHHRERWTWIHVIDLTVLSHGHEHIHDGSMEAWKPPSACWHLGVPDVVTLPGMVVSCSYICYRKTRRRLAHRKSLLARVKGLS